MFDPERLLGQMLGGALGNSLGGGSARRRKRGLSGLMSGSGVGKAQLGVGLLGVAMAAWEHYSKSSETTPQTQPAAIPPPPPAASSPPTQPPPPPAAEAIAATVADDALPTRAAPMMDLRRQEAVLLIRTMVAAAAADGAIDADERSAILDRARALGDDPRAQQFLQAELENPVSLEQLLAQVPRSLASEVYAAAVLAIDIDTERERQWLSALADGLGLDAEQREHLHRELGLA